MESTGTKHPRFFPTPFLLILLGISVLTNVVFLVKLNYPGLWERFQMALLPAPKVLPTDHIRGNPNAPVTVIEYSDFQCPYSARFHVSMKAVLAEADVRWVYRHFPLDRIHPLAARAGEASECAGEQGRFWEYADALFERQYETTDSLFSEIAGSLDLDSVAFEKCLASGKFRSVIAAHREDGAKQKIAATPTFYVNGKRFQGILPDADLKRIILQKGG